MAKGEIISVDIKSEIEQSYLDYAMSVIVGRALPDVRDGLKPVQRRVLFAMYEMGNLHNKAYKKSARIVGDVIGKFHPHGDSAVYETLVRMAQDFSLRYPLIDGQGNFGSIDGDSAAAMRYTEIRLRKITQEILADLEKNTVDFVPNYDGSLKEPTVFPTKIPNLLINGSTGIAVAMSSNIPPHNLTEVINGLIELIKNPDMNIYELMEYIQGPDFPTYGIINGKSGIRDAYLTGKGLIKVRARAQTETKKNDRVSIIITEIPFMVEKSNILAKIGALIQSKRIEGISDLRDESNRDGIRIVIELKRNIEPRVLMNQLYKETPLENSFNIIFTALVDNQPRVLNLKEILEYFIDHRKEIIIRRTQFELEKAEAKAHILEGLKIALDNIDEVIAIIKSSKGPKEAKFNLMARFKFSDIQAQAILDMKLQRLTNLEHDKIIADYEETLKLIEKLKFILDNEDEVERIMISELEEIKEKYGDERRTEIRETEKEVTFEDTVQDGPMVITVTHTGYIKRTDLNNFRKYNNRGGKGVVGAGRKEADFVEHLFIANSKSYILFFSNKGKVYWLKVYNIPEASRTSQGKSIVNLIDFQDKDEKITAFLPVKKFVEDRYIIMVSEKGYIKKVSLNAFSKPKRKGIIALSLEKGDNLISVAQIRESDNVFIGTSKGISIHFSSDQVREMGRTARGVRAIKLTGDNKVIDLVITDINSSILAVADEGIGKRTKVGDFKLQSRGGKGIIAIKLKNNSKAIKFLQVYDDDEIMLITDNSKTLRFSVNKIPVTGRNTQGVILIRAKEGEKVAAVAKVVDESSNISDSID